TVRSGSEGKLRLENGRLPRDPEVPDDKNIPDGGIDRTGFNDAYWVGLSLLHTLFAREHNAICDMLRATNPTWGDEKLFQTARLVIAALMAKIHTVEWTTAILGHPALQIGMNANWAGVQGEQLRHRCGRLTDNDGISGLMAGSTEHHA